MKGQPGVKSMTHHLLTMIENEKIYRLRMKMTIKSERGNHKSIINAVAKRKINSVVLFLP